MNRAKLHLALLLIASTLVGHAAEPADSAGKDAAKQKERLASLQTFVGSWRGVAQPQRGSNKGAWTEQAEWAWRFQADRTALVAKIADGKFFSTFQLQPDEQPDHFVLLATPVAQENEAAAEPIRYQGRLDDEGKLILTAADPPAGLPTRISFRTVAHGDRLLVLYESQVAARERFGRLAEVGYTRKGSRFGQGSTGPECVVTGGFGSIEVSYQGKKYFVCCTGCRDYFNDNPEEVLAEYAARKQAEKAKKAE
jgi:hypothetical protein